MSAALRVCLTAFAVIWLAVAGWAQDAGTASGIDFENWANTVARAETAIERDAASDQAFANSLQPLDPPPPKTQPMQSRQRYKPAAPS